MEGLQWWCIHDLSLSLEREDDEGGKGDDTVLYTASQGLQVDEREAHFWEESSRSQNRPL
jgi:hypothetical protein